MNLSITTRLFATALVLMLAFGLTLSTVSADHPEETNHTEIEHTSVDTAEITQMKTLITILTQLIALLQDQVEGSDSHSHGDSHDSDSDALAVWIEIHSNKTHAHVQEPGEELETFFIEDIAYTEEAAIITAIAEHTGLSEDAITEVITYPSGAVDENGDSIEEEVDDHAGGHDDEVDLDGLHIMADGTIMLGSGDVLEGASITDDGMVMLEDGDIVEPEFDLR